VPLAPVAVPDACAGFEGLTLEAGQFLATERGLTVRIVSVDGVDSMVSLDYLLTRVNLDIEAGVVTGCGSG